MNAQTKVYTVQVFGTDYKIVSDEPEARLMQASAKVDHIMKETANASKNTDKYKIAVLAALQIANELLATQQEVTTKKNHETVVMARLERILALLS